MSVQAIIQSVYLGGIQFFTEMLNLRQPDLSTEFVPAATRLFLSDILDARVKAEPAASQRSEQEVFDQSLKEFVTRLERAIKQEAKNEKLSARLRAPLDTGLAGLKVDSQLTNDTWRSPDLFFQIMRARGTFGSRGLNRAEALTVLYLVLRAVQEVALNVIRKDYPLQIPPVEVPVEIQTAIRKVFQRVNDISRNFELPLKFIRGDSAPPIKSANRVETELRLLVSRNSGSACLPLRPIATSPLGNQDFAQSYASAPSEEILKLSRQIRHADGTVLVSGYRGVGKSTFVNRVIYEALGAQDEFPADGCLMVPVTVNLAKVSGVQNILRVTLRTVRETLLEEDNTRPCPVPSRNGASPDRARLPLTEEEIDHLNEAYLRAAYKVTMGTSISSQKSREFGGGLNIDPVKMLGGLTGLGLASISAKVKRKRVEEVSRQIGYLDYDENAAEDDLRWLVGRLAKSRPYRVNDQREVRIKLVFVFDELDKMDVDSGLKPMIEGLKNLFLQQSAVFFLVTSKKFYYDLLKDRAIEDAMLNSYFSAIVNVPLLQFAEAHQMVKQWIFWEATDELKNASPNELELIKRLARVLVYKSCGNPRDMIRELRRMLEWADTQQPFLSDRGNNARSFQVFAAIQDCVEKTVGQSTRSSPDDGSAALVSDRLIGDEARLEQLRRGLYILMEELINRKRIVITSTDGAKLPPPPGTATDATPQTLSPASISTLMEQWVRLNTPKTNSAALSVLEKIQKDNFSLVSLEDVQDLAKRLGGFLQSLHLSLDLPNAPSSPLFEFRSAEELVVTDNFYDLTGRQAVAASSEAPKREIDPQQLVSEAEFRADKENWQDKETAINLIKRLGLPNLTPKLKDFLLKTAESAPDPTYRLMAAEQLSPELVFADATRDVSQLLQSETDDRVLAVHLYWLGGAKDSASCQRATTAILDLLAADGQGGRKLTETTAVNVLTVLPTVVESGTDVTDKLLKWLARVSVNELVQRTALDAFTRLAAKANIDPVNKILSDEQILRAFLPKQRFTVNAFTGFLKQPEAPAEETILSNYLRDLLRANPLKYCSDLLRAAPSVNLDRLLADTWDAAFQPKEDALANRIFELLAERNKLSAPIKSRLMDSLRLTSEFETRLLPYLQNELEDQRPRFEANEYALMEQALVELKTSSDMANASAKLADLAAKTRSDPFLDLLRNREQVNRNRYAVSGYTGEINPTRAAVCTAISAVTFALGAIFFRFDLPAGAGVRTIILSRLILLVLDAAIFTFVFKTFPAKALQNSYSRTAYPYDTKWHEEVIPELVRAGFAIGLAIGAYYLHTRLIGPLNQKIQALQFLINLPTLMIASYGFTRDDWSQKL